MKLQTAADRFAEKLFYIEAGVRGMHLRQRQSANTLILFVTGDAAPPSAFASDGVSTLSVHRMSVGDRLIESSLSGVSRIET
jgi:hypothetical protein